MRASSRIARILYSHKIFAFLYRQKWCLTTVHIFHNINQDKELWDMKIYENLMLSIIADVYMERLNSAVEKSMEFMQLEPYILKMRS